VFVEFHETMADAILREKRIKKWRRAWKLELIERHNRQWRPWTRAGGERPLPAHLRHCSTRGEGRLTGTHLPSGRDLSGSFPIDPRELIKGGLQGLRQKPQRVALR
jgi:hypothetical protein